MFVFDYLSIYYLIFIKKIKSYTKQFIFIKGINDGKITKEEFIDYYTYISSSVDNDQYFELMMNNAWRINDGANKNWEKKVKNYYFDEKMI